MERRFFIICLKRSRFTGSSKMRPITRDWFDSCSIVYWKDDCKGYTNDQSYAGRYTLDEIKDCNGSYLDWFVVPTENRVDEE